jgi:hypothetical protein
MTTTTPEGSPATSEGSPGAPEGSPDLNAPLITDADVLRRVAELVDQDPRQRTLWLFFMSPEGVQLPVVVPIDGLPPRPDPRYASNLCWIITNVVDNAAPGSSAVITLSRPGEPELGCDDRSWFRTLRQAAQDRGAPIRMMCLATPAGVRPASPSEILAA